MTPSDRRNARRSVLGASSIASASVTISVFRDDEPYPAGSIGRPPKPRGPDLLRGGAGFDPPTARGDRQCSGESPATAGKVPRPPGHVDDEGHQPGRGRRWLDTSEFDATRGVRPLGGDLRSPGGHGEARSDHVQETRAGCRPVGVLDELDTPSPAPRRTSPAPVDSQPRVRPSDPLRGLLAVLPLTAPRRKQAVGRQPLPSCTPEG
jgi:hypothetical protein